MSDGIRVPVKVVGADRWGQLSMFGEHHLICGEDVRVKDQNYTFAGGHRVRLYSFKKNVHWKIPAGIQLNVEGVPPATQPRREQRR
jgi:hypothetical protein